MYYVYLLKLNSGDYYTGFSSNLKSRIKAHQNGQNKSTKDQRPVELMWYAAFYTKQLAMDFEEYLKSSSGFAFRNKHLI